MTIYICVDTDTKGLKFLSITFNVCEEVHKNKIFIPAHYSKLTKAFTKQTRILVYLIFL